MSTTNFLLYFTGLSRADKIREILKLLNFFKLKLKPFPFPLIELSSQMNPGAEEIPLSVRNLRKIDWYIPDGYHLKYYETFWSNRDGSAHGMSDVRSGTYKVKVNDFQEVLEFYDGGGYHRFYIKYKMFEESAIRMEGKIETRKLEPKEKKFLQLIYDGKLVY